MRTTITRTITSRTLMPAHTITGIMTMGTTTTTHRPMRTTMATITTDTRTRPIRSAR